MNTLELTEDTRRYMKGMEILLEHPAEIPVGTTPSEVVYTEDKMRLLHYIPTV